MEAGQHSSLLNGSCQQADNMRAKEDQDRAAKPFTSVLGFDPDDKDSIKGACESLPLPLHNDVKLRAGCGNG